tara:strand:+ start:1575 stop:1769 length:195 start_codon:yes stop_codon:yes gene_type:complete
LFLDTTGSGARAAEICGPKVVDTERVRLVGFDQIIPCTFEAPPFDRIRRLLCYRFLELSREFGR